MWPVCADLCVVRCVVAVDVRGLGDGGHAPDALLAVQVPHRQPVADQGALVLVLDGGGVGGRVKLGVGEAHEHHPLLLRDLTLQHQVLAPAHRGGGLVSSSDSVTLGVNHIAGVSLAPGGLQGLIVPPAGGGDHHVLPLGAVSRLEAGAGGVAGGLLEDLQLRAPVRVHAVVAGPHGPPRVEHGDLGDGAAEEGLVLAAVGAAGGPEDGVGHLVAGDHVVAVHDPGGRALHPREELAARVVAAGGLAL